MNSNTNILNSKLINRELTPNRTVKNSFEDEIDKNEETSKDYESNKDFIDLNKEKEIKMIKDLSRTSDKKDFTKKLKLISNKVKKSVHKMEKISASNNFSIKDSYGNKRRRKKPFRSNRISIIENNNVKYSSNHNFKSIRNRQTNISTNKQHLINNLAKSFKSIEKGQELEGLGSSLKSKFEL